MLSTVFTFAPVPLTDELSPLAVAADLARRRQADKAFTDAHTAPSHSAGCPEDFGFRDAEVGARNADRSLVGLVP